VQQLPELSVCFLVAPERAQSLDFRGGALFRQRAPRKFALVLGNRYERLARSTGVQLGLGAGQQRHFFGEAVVRAGDCSGRLSGAICTVARRNER